jgi:two-component system, NarL family, invasion response regulator UvrY
VIPRAQASVIAVDDHPEFLEVLCKVVGATPGMALVGEAMCGEEAVRLVEELRPDLVVMDVRMPGIGGVGATRRIKTAHPSTIVALVTSCSPEDLLAEDKDSEADVLICKQDLRPRLLEEIWRQRLPA